MYSYLIATHKTVTTASNRGHPASSAAAKPIVHVRFEQAEQSEDESEDESEQENEDEDAEADEDADADEDEDEEVDENMKDAVDVDKAKKAKKAAAAMEEATGESSRGGDSAFNHAAPLFGGGD